VLHAAQNLHWVSSQAHCHSEIRSDQGPMTCSQVQTVVQHVTQAAPNNASCAGPAGLLAVPYSASYYTREYSKLKQVRSLQCRQWSLAVQ
jgi:hypothetical protein